MADDFMSDEDKALFRDQMRSVKPLNEKTQRIKSPARVVSDKPRRKKDPIEATQQDNYLSDYISEAVLSESVLSYATSSIPNKRLRELRMGQIKWESRLDLHGLKAEAAREALYRFIKIQTEQGKRCLLIIHGKGGHQGAPPVIKNLVNRWLPQFDEVLAFHSAQAKDGGHGAVYVLLKRNRSHQDETDL